MTGYSAVMATTAVLRAPDLSKPHPNLSDEVNRNIVQSEIEGGVYLDELSEGSTLEVETQNHWYTIIIRSRGEELIWGHPRYCPGEDRGVHVGRLDAEATVYRTRHVPGIPPSDLSENRDVPCSGHSGLGAARDQCPSADKPIAHASRTCRTTENSPP
jgi:hypothetical protein